MLCLNRHDVVHWVFWHFFFFLFLEITIYLTRYLEHIKNMCIWVGEKLSNRGKQKKHCSPTLHEVNTYRQTERLTCQIRHVLSCVCINVISLSFDFFQASEAHVADTGLNVYRDWGNVSMEVSAMLWTTTTHFWITLGITWDLSPWLPLTPLRRHWCSHSVT